MRQIANIESSPKRISLPPPQSKPEIKHEPQDHPALHRMKIKEHKVEKIKPVFPEQKVEKLRNTELHKTKSSITKALEHTPNRLNKSQSVPPINSHEKPVVKNAMHEAASFLELYDSLLQDSLHNISKYEANLDNPLFNSSPSIKRLVPNGGVNDHAASDSLFPKWLSSKKEAKPAEEAWQSAQTSKNIWSPKTLRENLPDVNALNKILFELNSQTPQGNDMNEKNSTNLASKLLQTSDFSPSLFSVQNNPLFQPFLNGPKGADLFKSMSPSLESRKLKR